MEFKSHLKSSESGSHSISQPCVRELPNLQKKSSSHCSIPGLEVSSPQFVPGRFDGPGFPWTPAIIIGLQHRPYTGAFPRTPKFGKENFIYFFSNQGLNTQSSCSFNQSLNQQQELLMVCFVKYASRLWK